MKATSGDFSRVMQVVKDQICRALKDKQLSMELFKASQMKQQDYIASRLSFVIHVNLFYP